MRASQELERTFAALAEPTRLAVIGLLRRGPRRAGDLASALDQSAPAMSRHLRVLRRAGLVEERGLEEDARVRMYRLRPERFAELGAWLEEVNAFWSEQLDAFAAHVRRKAARGDERRRR
jgi:DNA-binding transcriptional ArsR family regulator